LQAQPAPCDHCVSRTFSTELIIGTVLDTDGWPSTFRCLDVASRIKSTHLGSWVPPAVIALIVLLAVGVAGHHPQLSRQEAIDAALSRQAQQTSHHAAKLIRESDLERAASHSGENIGEDTSPDHFIWVVAVSGDYAVPGEYMGGPPTTWTIMVVNDRRPGQLSEVWGGVRGNWPAFFDGLIDLS